MVNALHFSDRYGELRSRRASLAAESSEAVREEVVQCVWYDQLFDGSNLRTTAGKRVKVVSPGWWNHGEGPDFKGAQLEIDGELRSGDVEIHLDARGWSAHGHDSDERYDDVILHVVLRSGGAAAGTSDGHQIPTLVLGDYLEEDIGAIADRILVDEYPYKVAGTPGRCAGLVEAYGSGQLTRLLELAGDWRMLFKARALRMRMDRVGVEQAAYEAFMYACGFGHFKYHFRALAEQLHYERARQLAREDALLLEAACFQLAGLLPEALPHEVPHFERMQALRRASFAGMKQLPLEWRRANVRPTNFPERRLAGAARFLSRTAKDGLVASLEEIWAADLEPIARRKAFEKLFPKPIGFWAIHCTWTGKSMETPSAMIGAGRVRSIVGNVFVPLALALARQYHDRVREERVMAFFAALPKEPENKIQKIMLPRVFGDGNAPKLNFRLQQGLLQLYTDWCEPNPSCRNCGVIPFLEVDGPRA